ncbi:hypothetical protein Sru01_33260 [Sphaerisporangium rufum]|uniref:NlpC/P60 domain-containing protein n=1 Tax=Sphaerisporangium rufum TaxID=1381558 RepID=A0A919V024_9ACTN|nr:NlpC/P60 family protein [Sphaerisporangium rufum]GII78344.1 hypothetical protein Sru01_33260 [Sphaerisporangium rufum]
MTDWGHVSALPGGAELAAVAARVDGDPAAIRAVAERWKTAAGDIARAAGEIGDGVTWMDADWNGDSADAFGAYIRRLGKAGGDLQVMLAGGVEPLSEAAAALEKAGTEIDELGAHLLDYAAEVRRMNPDAPRDQQDQIIRQEAAAAAGLARGHADTANAKLAQAGAAIKRLAGANPRTFRAVPEPDRQPFVPQPGHTVQWIPVSREESRATELSGGAAGPGAGPVGGHGGGAGDGRPGSPGLAMPPVYATGRAKAIIDAAESKLGRPYVWGADGPNAFDCSGLVHWSLNQARYGIGDNTAAGYQSSFARLAPEDVKPGDIVFFGNPAYHCGIVVETDGNGHPTKMIAAPHSGDVVKVQNIADVGKNVSYGRPPAPGA